MKKLRSLLLASLLVVGAQAFASSHREAPFITENPKVDATDFYMFRSYETGRAGYVTIIANYLPLQDPYGGPNYFSLDPNALYRINLDTNGDAREDFAFEFTFSLTNKKLTVNVGGKDVPVPVANIGGITAGSEGALNYDQNFQVRVIERASEGKRAKATLLRNGSGTTFDKPFDNVGEKTYPDYAAYANTFIKTITLPDGSEGRVFVGQRKDPFVVNLGEIFDLVNVENPIGSPSVERDDLEDKNVTSLILELPISYLTKDGANPIIGGWTTASLRKVTSLADKPTFDRPAVTAGPWVQVSRLGNPLVNEVVIGLPDKDKFNNSQPRNDAQFATYVTNPTLPAIIEILFGPTVKAPTLFPRTDLVAAFLTGVEGLNKTATVCEYMRLNTNIAPTAAGSQNNLGVIGGDNAGFPNGRRPGDDVVDIALRVAMGRLITLGFFGTKSQAPSGDLDFTDGATVNASFFDTTFPYLKPPIPGSVLPEDRKASK